MTLDIGYIILSRSIVDSAVFQNEKWFRVWTWCLLEATYKKEKTKPVKTGKGWTNVKIKRGQFIFGRNKHAKDLSMHPSTLWKIMLKLKSLGNLNIQSNSHYSIITICNYDLYQDISNYKVTGKVTTREQPSNNQVTHLKEGNEGKTGKKTTIPTVAPEFQEYEKPESLKKWADKKGLSKSQLENYIETCLTWHGSKGTKHVKWDKAIQTWVNRDLKKSEDNNNGDLPESAINLLKEVSSG